ncbi:MAG: hypothetical protein AB8D78_12445 [Akkermansiaceae bacterium]
MKNPIIIAIAIGLASCAAPKATVVAETPKEKTEEKPSEVVAETTLPAGPDDGLRIGDDILALPSDEELRPSTASRGDGDATVITRPPAE